MSIRDMIYFIYEVYFKTSELTSTPRINLHFPARTIKALESVITITLGTTALLRRPNANCRTSCDSRVPQLVNGRITDARLTRLAAA